MADLLPGQALSRFRAPAFGFLLSAFSVGVLLGIVLSQMLQGVEAALLASVVIQVGAYWSIECGPRSVDTWRLVHAEIALSSPPVSSSRQMLAVVYAVTWVPNAPPSAPGPALSDKPVAAAAESDGARSSSASGSGRRRRQLSTEAEEEREELLGLQEPSDRPAGLLASAPPSGEHLPRERMPCLVPSFLLVLLFAATCPKHRSDSAQTQPRGGATWRQERQRGQGPMGCGLGSAGALA